MKEGRSLVELAQEIERRRVAKQDYLAPTQALKMVDRGPQGVGLELGGNDVFDVNKVAHNQIAEYTGIPARYYQKMQEDAPDLLATNVNRWFDKYPAVKMVRTLDRGARAFLSDKFRTDMENEDFAEAVLPVVQDLGLDIMSCEITDTRLYIKAVDPRVSRELAKASARFGDGGHTIVRCLAPAVTISNSEVGLGALSIQGGTFDRWCSNLASFGERSMKQAHVGVRQTLGEGELYAMLSDKTKRLDSAALWSRVRDIVRGVFDAAKFESLCQKIEGTQADRIESDDVVRVIEKVTKRFDINDGEGKSVLKHLIETGELSRFGISNAITRMAQDVDSYDRATELERIGAKVIELPKSEWKALATAA